MTTVLIANFEQATANQTKFWSTLNYQSQPKTKKGKCKPKRHKVMPTMHMREICQHCVCVLCVFISFHCKDFSWLNKTIVVLSPYASASDDMLRKHFCVKDLCFYFKGNHKKNLEADNCAKECQINRVKTREVKGNSYKFSKNQQ